MIILGKLEALIFVTFLAYLVRAISPEYEHALSRIASDAVEGPLHTLRWDGLNLSSISAVNPSPVAGGPKELLQELQDPVLMGLGCIAAAFQLSNGNWSRYHSLGSSCWTAIGVSTSDTSQSSLVPPFAARTVARMSGQLSAAGSAVSQCAAAEPGSEMLACVPSSMGDTFESLDAATQERLGVTIVPWVRAGALSIVALAWVAVASFVWNAQGALIWIVLTLVVGTFTMAVMVYQLAMLSIAIVLFALVRCYSKSSQRLSTLATCCVADRGKATLLKQLRSARTYAEWAALQRQLERRPSEESTTISPGALVAKSDDAEQIAALQNGQGGNLKMRRVPSSPCCNRRIPEEPAAQTDDDLLCENIASLSSAISNSDVRKLLLILRGQLTRNHAGINESNVAGSKWIPKPLALQYLRSLENAMNFVVDSDADKSVSLEEKSEFFRQCQQTVGTTALCLSGGGALAMYHMGVCKELIQQGLLPSVISGTSGGSIVIGFLTMYTDEELLRDVFVDDISTRYPERWFPNIWEEIMLFMRKRVLVRTADFARTTRRYFGDTTFEEAYARTGRNCSISICTYSSQGRRTGASLLLNHMTSPHVTISSAVAASCALPGIMGPHRLMAKLQDGTLQVFDSGGREFVDGTLKADIPKRRLAEMFHCNQYMVSQVNPHIAPFLRRSERKAAAGRGVLRKIEDWMSMDIRHRVQVLTKFGLMPTILGIDLGNVGKQNYGHFGTGVMFVPDCIHMSDAMRATKNPTPEDMRHFIYNGQRCVWDKVEHIRHILLVEKTLNQCVARLRCSSKAQSPLHSKANGA